jgi:ligand-binding sensor domain-containing protein
VIQKFTNLNGLLNIDLTSLAIDSQERLWVGAIDGSISIYNVSNGTWRYIFDIKNSTESDKTIHYFRQDGNFMFVATGYGIHKIGISDFRFIDAPYTKLGGIPINTPVYSLTFLNNNLFAATKAGVAYANYTTSNLNDPASWTSYRFSPLNTDVVTIETFDNKVFAGSPTGFMYFNGSTWVFYPNGSVSSTNIKSIKAIGDDLYFISGLDIYYSHKSNLSSITPFVLQNNFTTLSHDNDLNPIAGTTNSGILIKIGNQFEYEFPNGPLTNNFNHLAIDGEGNLWAAGGTGTAGFYMFDGSLWTNYNTATFPQIGNSNWFQKIVASGNKVWAISFGGGPTLLENGIVVQNYNPSNSNLPGSADPNFSAAYGGGFDNNDIFWVTYFVTNTGRSLYAFTGSNTWVGIQNPTTIATANYSEVAVDNYNTKWVTISGQRNGLYFFNENGTINNPGDDVFGFYSNDEFGSEVQNIVDVIVDKNNEVWIATNNGVFIIRNPLAAIQNPSQKPRPEKLGIISGGFRVPFTENCTSIARDILNDKWIGTETNGVFHLSADGNTLIKQFNTVNSPILSNKITDVIIDNTSGKAYFGTLSGLSSYITDAVEPIAEFDKIISSPNPYLVPSGTQLKIDGLVENSSIKIMKLNGEVVSEFITPGGRIATWNGMNNNNEPVSTGIYIIVAYNKDGSKVGTGKVAIIRK